MDFIDIKFIFLFLPVFSIIYLGAGKRLRNLIALGASLLFFAQGEPRYLPLMLGLVVANYFLARQIEREIKNKGLPLRWTIIGIVCNLGVLFVFKFVTTCGAAVFTSMGISLPEWWFVRLNKLPYPLGLSYITFQVLSYLIDIYRRVHPAEKNFISFSLYIMLFPKIVVGPITRYNSIAKQLNTCEVSSVEVASGLRRFMVGLAKKVLIADQLARIVTPVFSLARPDISPGIAWMVLVCFSLQIYFDFSGYTDMAIGLGKTLGFNLPENFNYPYIAKNISEFWWRWHISLSSWFRDYVFFPLERRRIKYFGQQLNVLIVFFLTGLWHGMTLPMIAWGLLHGVAVAFETTRLGRRLRSAWPPIQHFYAMFVLLVGWVFFRSPSMAFALSYLGRLVGMGKAIEPMQFSLTKPLPFIENSVWTAFAVGILFSLPIIQVLRKSFGWIYVTYPAVQKVSQIALDVLVVGLMFLSIVFIFGGAPRPNIYGKF